jgi:hypothetical protein
MASISGVPQLVRKLKALSTAGRKKATAKCGYAAEYSVYVHEDLTKRHGEVFNNYYAHEISTGAEHPRRLQEQAQFLSQPLRENQARLANIVATAVRNKEGVRVAVERAARFLMQKSAEIVPIDTGYMLSTAYIVVTVS